METQDEIPSPTIPAFYSHGKDMHGAEYKGFGMSTRECAEEATRLGSSTCHVEANPEYVAPQEAQAVPGPSEDFKLGFDVGYLAGIEEAKAGFIPGVDELSEAAYKKGFADADVAYQDVKSLIQHWAADKAATTSENLDDVPFVVYIRHNR